VGARSQVDAWAGGREVVGGGVGEARVGGDVVGAGRGTHPAVAVVHRRSRGPRHHLDARGDVAPDLKVGVGTLDGDGRLDVVPDGVVVDAGPWRVGHTYARAPGAHEEVVHHHGSAGHRAVGRAGVDDHVLVVVPELVPGDRDLAPAVDLDAVVVEVVGEGVMDLVVGDDHVGAVPDVDPVGCAPCDVVVLDGHGRGRRGPAVAGQRGIQAARRDLDA